MHEFKSMEEIRFDSQSIRVAHGGTLDRNAEGEMVFSDSTDREWHLLRLYSEALRNVMVGVEIRVQAAASCHTDFYINAMGGLDVAVVSSCGEIKDRGISRALETQSHQDGSLTVRALYESRDGSATFGTFLKSGVYAGFGSPQFYIKSVRIYAKKGNWFDLINLGDKITLIDIGAAGGLQDKWVGFEDRLRCVFFEPGEKAATELRNTNAGVKEAQVLEVALSNIDGMQRLYLTRFPQCSSLLKPREDNLVKYKVAACFEVVQSQDVAVRRYDSLWREGLVPSPDVIKIDVQGAEHEVLEGFGNLLSACIAIELETHFYEIYEGQKLICDIISYVKTYGLVLRKLEPQMSFDRDLVEVNAYFTRRRSLLETNIEDKKLQIVEQVWGLKEESPIGSLLTIKHGGV